MALLPVVRDGAVSAAAVAVLLVLAQLGDAVTAMWLPPGAELNPIRVAATPLAAVLLKAALVIYLLALLALHRRAGLVVVALGTIGGLVGMLSNLNAL